MNPQSSKYNKNQNRSTPFNKAVFPSKKEMLSWASIILDLKIDCIEQLTTGAIFCQLLDACNPGSVRMNKVNWSANNENEYINNFKVFQQGLIENNLQKDININRLSKGKQQELNDLLQWIYAYYMKFKDNYQGVYNAKRNRGNQNFVFASHNNKKNYRKKVIKDNYTNYSLSSNNSINSDINSDYSNYNNRSNNFNNNFHNRYNMKNFNKNLRNRSKKESKQSKYNEFYQERVLSNNKNDFSFSPNIPHNNKYNNNNNNYINNNSYFTQNRNYTQNNRQRTHNNFPTNKFDESNNINMGNVSLNKSINFPNIFETKTNANNDRNNLNLNQELYNNNNGQFVREEEELYNNNIENDDDDNYSHNDMDMDMTDYKGLN
jgi:hypothetical protein